MCYKTRNTYRMAKDVTKFEDRHKTLNRQTKLHSTKCKDFDVTCSDKACSYLDFFALILGHSPMTTIN